MIYIKSSNRLENLARIFAENIRRNPLGVFDREIIITQTPGMGKWLSLECARENSVVSGFSVSTPIPFMNSVIASPDAKLPDKTALAWIIFSKLSSGLIDRPEFERIKNYASCDRIKLFQLCARIADVFDQYSIYRPETAALWERGEKKISDKLDLPESDLWQFILWREIFNSGFTHRGKLLFDFLSGDGIAQSVSGIKRITLFAISTLPEGVIRFFSALSDHTEVSLYRIVASNHFIEDLRSEKGILTSFVREGIDPGEMHLDAGNPLLSSMGRMGIDFSSMLFGYNGDGGDDYSEEPGASTLLEKIQSDIFTLRRRTQPELVVADDSVSIHCCHSPLRELEVLRDHILLELDGSLRPHDIVVMVPDITAYSPFVRAVFDPEDDSLKIPYSLADVSSAMDSPLISALIRLLDFKSSRYSFSSFIDFISSPCVSSKFSVSDEEVSVISSVLYGAGLRWGLSAEERDSDYSVNYDDYSWRFALDRILLGYATGEVESLFCGISPYGRVDASSAQALDKALCVFRLMSSFCADLDGRMDVPSWCALLKKYIGEIFDIDEDINSYASVAGIIGMVEDAAATAGVKDEVESDLVIYEFRRQLDFDVKKKGFIDGGVTFCQMIPMRSIPFKFTAVIGLNSGDFPRSHKPLSFDLIARHHRRGDRTVKNDDRYLFLETIISARGKLYLSYTGRSIKTNEELAPSALLSEFMDYLSENFRLNDSDITGYLLRNHRLKQFSDDYFLGSDVRFFSYSRHDCVSINNSPARFLEKNTCLPAVKNDFFTMGGMISFFQDPARFVLSELGGIALSRVMESAAENEPLSLNSIDSGDIKMMILRLAVEGMDADEIAHYLSRSAVAPPARIGRLAIQAILASVSEIVKYVKAQKASVDSTLTRRVELSCSHAVLGGVLDCLRFSDGTCGRLFIETNFNYYNATKIWIEHLFLAASGESVFSRMISVNDASVYDIVPVDRAVATQILRALAEIYAENIRRPKPIPVKLLYDFAKENFDSGVKPKSVRSAKKTLENADAGEDAGEDNCARLMHLISLELKKDGSRTFGGRSDFQKPHFIRLFSDRYDEDFARDNAEYLSSVCDLIWKEYFSRRKKSEAML